MKRIFALLLSLAVLFSCLAVTAGAMFDPSTVYDVKAQSAYIVVIKYARKPHGDKGAK